MEASIEWLGIAGNILLVGSYLPQIYKTYRSKSSADISLLMWAAYILGDICFLIYSVVKNQPAFIVLFALFTLENIAVLYLAILYRKPAQAHENIS